MKISERVLKNNLYKIHKKNLKTISFCTTDLELHTYIQILFTTKVVSSNAIVYKIKKIKFDISLKNKFFFLEQNYENYNSIY